MKVATVLIMTILIVLGCRDNFENQYYPDGTLKSRAMIKDGIYDGEFSTYFPSGKIKSKGVWYNGAGNGCRERYFENGQSQEKSCWKDGLEHGIAEVFYPTGNIKYRGEFREGKKIGEHLNYRESGELLDRVLYSEDSQMYYLSKWSRNGDKEMELVFPSLEFSKIGDSLSIKAYSRIKLKGNAFLSVGTKSEDEEFMPSVSNFKVDHNANEVKILWADSTRTLYYKFDYYPATSDSLAKFGYSKKLFQEKEQPRSFQAAL